MRHKQNLAEEIRNRFLAMENREEAEHLARFFKTGEGEYGFGDKYLGVRVPVTRSIVKEYKNLIDAAGCVSLIKSEWHEIRLAGFLLLIEIYRKAKKQKDYKSANEIVSLYIENISYGNNWDLVDLVCSSILGDWLIDHPQERQILDKFAEMDASLWHQRVAMVATFSLIRAGQYADTLRIAEKYLTHKHDLIHKATGWMLREMGKRGGYNELLKFLDQYAHIMPRTALRYSIERFPEALRQHYLKK